jgi:hypothetical protein
VTGSLHLGLPTLNTWVNDERKKRFKEENLSEALALCNVTPGRVAELLLLTEIFAFSGTVCWRTVK